MCELPEWATYRNGCAASGANATPAADPFDGPARLRNICVTNLPSTVNTWTRRLGRSATYTSPSFDTLTPWTWLPNCGAPGASVSSFGAGPRPPPPAPRPPPSPAPRPRPSAGAAAPGAEGPAAAFVE